VSRDATVDDLVKAIRRSAHGEYLGPAWLMPMLLRRVATGPHANGPPPALERLTRREREVLALIAEGLANKEIAGRLRIELPTVKNHVHNILEKLEVRRRSEAVAQLQFARGWAPV
jgi:DNA-binding NarL/FixJ family response regulator